MTIKGTQLYSTHENHDVLTMQKPFSYVLEKLILPEHYFHQKSKKIKDIWKYIGFNPIITFNDNLKKYKSHFGCDKIIIDKFETSTSYCTLPAARWSTVRKCRGHFLNGHVKRGQKYGK